MFINMDSPLIKKNELLALIKCLTHKYEKNISFRAIVSEYA